MASDIEAECSKADSNNPDGLEDVLLTLEEVKYVEQNLSLYEKIAVSFLFYDDRELCLRICKSCVRDRNFSILHSFLKDKSPETWSMKVLQCLTLIQNYHFILERLSISPSDASAKFKKKSYIPPLKLMLYNITDSLTVNETKLAIDSLNSTTKDEHLEIIFLKLTSQSEWKNFIDVLSRIIKDPQLQKELNACLEEMHPTEVQNRLSSYAASTPNTQKRPLVPTLANNIYPIKDPDNVGLCIIINEMEFQTFTARRGSDKDVAVLEETFSQFNFKIEVLHNKPSTFFGKPFVELINRLFEKNYSIFVLVILSHGKEGAFFGSDDKPVLIQSHILWNLSFLSCLQDIPKVLIIQACQGDKFLLSKKLVTDGKGNVSNVETDDSKATLKDFVGIHIRDTLIAMSTVPGFKSFRDTGHGSYFIQTLCDCLKKYCYDPIQDIITEVINLVREQVVKSSLKNLDFAQHPEYRSLLAKKLYFKIKPKPEE